MIISSFIKKVLLLVFRKRTIIFESGDNISDNGFVFLSYVLKNGLFEGRRKYFISNKPYKVYKGTFPKSSYLRVPSNFFERIRFYIISMNADYIFFSYDNYWKYIHLSSSTKIVYIKHGEFPIKSVKEYYDSLFLNENSYYFLCNTPYIADVIRKKYNYRNVHFFIADCPRNDLLKRANEGTFKKALNIPQDSKIITIATTYRSFHNKDSDFFRDDFPIQLTHNDLRRLNDIGEEHNCYFVFKIHHALMCNIDHYRVFSHIVFVNNGILEKHKLSNFNLLIDSNALFTDFSNIYISYLALNRPVSFFFSDFEKYKKKRGFTLNSFDHLLPGGRIYNFHDFENEIGCVLSNIDKYSEKRKIAKKLLLGEYSESCKTLVMAVKKL